MHSSYYYYVWWFSFIFLLLRTNGANFEPSLSSDHRHRRRQQYRAAPKSAEKLGLLECDSDDQCTFGGACLMGPDGKKHCLCSSACPSVVPASCTAGRSVRGDCLSMGDDYRSKYDLAEPTCYKDMCVCPPEFEPHRVDPLRNAGIGAFPPMKCDKRELAVVSMVSPSDSVYRGVDADLYCCLNVHPHDLVAADGLEFVQNDTLIREPTDTLSNDIADTLTYAFQPATCWRLHIKNVQFTDSGRYMCRVRSSFHVGTTVVDSLAFVVKGKQPVVTSRPMVVEGVRARFSTNDRASLVDDHQEMQEGRANGDSPPRTVKNLNVEPNGTSVTIDWDLEQGPMIKIDMRLVLRTTNDEVWSRKNAKSPIIVNGLQSANPYTLFTTVIDGLEEPAFFTNQFTTRESEPDPPTLVDIRRINMGDRIECEFEWKPPKTPNGRILKYWVTLSGAVRHLPSDGSLTSLHFPRASTPGCNNFGDSAHRTDAVRPSAFPNDFLSCRFGPLRPNRNYTASLVAENGAGLSAKVAFTEQCVTDFGQPDVIETPKLLTPATGVQRRFETDFSLVVPPAPLQTNGPISCFYIAIVPLLRNMTIERLPSPGALVFDTYTKTLTNNRLFASSSLRYFAYIAESYSDLLPEITVIGDGNSSAGVQPCNTWCLTRDLVSNGFLSRNEPSDDFLVSGLKYTGFLIVRVDRDIQLMRQLRSEFHTPRRRRRRSRSSSRSSRRRRRRRRSGQVHYSPDPAYGFSTYFSPVFLAVIDSTYDSPSPDSSWWSFLLLLFVMLSTMLLFSSAIVYIMHRKGFIKELCPKKKEHERLLIQHTGFQPIPVDDLPGEYIMRHRDSDFLFSVEFDALPHYNNFDTVASEKRENQRKNRYNDIKAFDVTRVKLTKSVGHEDGDYVNANFVHGYKGRKTFIAAQGPLEQTIDDFWRMIWEHKVHIVVMVTNLYEKYRVQCSKYWPDENSCTYGAIVVRPVESTYYSDYAIRTFHLCTVQSVGLCDETSLDEAENGAAPMARSLVQYHYTGWSDYRAPECTTGLLRFVTRLRKLDPFHNSPVVVHCSAGVGRTGTFIAIDGVLDQCQEEGKADVFGFVSNLRRQRNFMVQSLEQYVFVYKALAEWHLFGDTDIELDRIHEHVAELHENWTCHTSDRHNSPLSSKSPKLTRSSKNSSIGIEAEFKNLTRTLENGRSCEFGRKDENVGKNRYESILPYDRNRVVLSPLVGHLDASYINASVVKGYFYPYILTQDPINQNACFDFWRMIGEQNATSIVMLSNEEDIAIDEKYWPDDLARGKTYGKHSEIAVKLASEDRNSTYTLRKFTYSGSKDNDLREVVQFCYRDWTPKLVDGLPRSTGTLLELIGRVLQRQSYLPDSGPIVLHCRDGSRRSGLYCCVSLLLERLKAESRVDVFQTVKSLQAQRPSVLISLVATGRNAIRIFA